MIYLTGAGCGDFRFLTQYARWAIEQADCILYDRLLDPQILSYAKKDCELIYVGKENHHHILSQEKINDLLVEKGKLYKVVVRLKGGDPYVFGRGSEEALNLVKQGLEFEIIPGIPSPIGGCAMVNIPVTHRGINQGIRIMSAHTKEDIMSDLDFSSMANSEDTLVFMMGLRNLEEIVHGLLKAKKPKNTPISLISNAGRYNQKWVSGTLDSILNQERSQIVSPTLIVVGNTISLQDKLQSKPKKLQGKHYALLGLRKEEDLKWRFAQQGAQLDVLQCGHRKERAFTIHPQDLQKCTYLVFTSANAIDAFYKQLFKQGMDARDLNSITLCVIGKKSGEALLNYGCHYDVIADIEDSEHFAALLKKRVKRNDHVLIPKVKNDRHTLKQALSTICDCQEIEVYQIEPDEFTLPTSCDGILFTCSFAVEQAMKKNKNNFDQETSVFAMGEPTRAALQAHGCKNVTALEKADRNCFLKTILKKESD